jgi:hypothetical protein
MQIIKNHYQVPLTGTFGSRIDRKLNRSTYSNWTSTELRIRDVYPASRVLIFVHPGSRISDPKTATKEKNEKNLLSYLFLVATNITKLKIILFLSI